MTALRSRLGAALLALVPVTMTAVGAGCGATTDLQTNEPTAQEREVTAAALLDQLSLEAALLDDSPSVRLLSAAMPTSTRIAEHACGGSSSARQDAAHGAREIPRACATVEGALPDADGDGIPSTASVHLDCSAAAYDVSGTAFMIDDNDQDPRAASPSGSETCAC